MTCNMQMKCENMQLCSVQWDIPTADGLNEFAEEFGCQWFRQDVRQLRFRGDPLNGHHPFMLFHKLIEMPVFHIDVLGSGATEFFVPPRDSR